MPLNKPIVTDEVGKQLWWIAYLVSLLFYPPYGLCSLMQGLKYGGPACCTTCQERHNSALTSDRSLERRIPNKSESQSKIQTVPEMFYQLTFRSQMLAFGRREKSIAAVLCNDCRRQGQVQSSIEGASSLRGIVMGSRMSKPGVTIIVYSETKAETAEERASLWKTGSSAHFRFLFIGKDGDI